MILAYLCLAAVPATAELNAIAERVLPDSGDSAAIVELSSGRLLLEHHPKALYEQRIVAGSVMKLFTGHALLEAGLADRETRCTGKHTDRYGTERVCWIRSGHGEVRFLRAIADSCNVWFYAAAQDLPPQLFLDTVRRFGIGEPWVSDLPAVLSDSVPGLLSERDLPDLAVGDALAMEVTPLSLLRAVSVIATRGRRVTPVRTRAAVIEQTELDRGHLDRLATAMEEAIESGTLAESLRGLDVAAKTGTAKKRGTVKTRGLVLGFFPRREPRYAFVVVKSEGRGAVDAAPPARALVEAMFGVVAPRKEIPAAIEVQVLGKNKPAAVKIAGECRSKELLVTKAHLSGSTVEACDARGRCVREPELILTCKRAVIDGRRFGDRLTLRASGSELRVLARVELEEYVAGVVESENAGAPREAKRALAITARTFALHALAHPRHEDAALCDLTHCQVFRETIEDRDRDTDGQVLRNERGELPPVFFHSTCGGKTVDADALWPDPSNRYLIGVDDPFCKHSPHARWVHELGETKLAAALSSLAGRPLDAHSVQLERAREDGTSWRIGDAQGTIEVGGETLHLELARTFGFGAVKSSDFTALRAGRNFRLSGRGLGHRVGLCQYGAAARAEAGHDARAILSAYFPKLKADAPSSSSTERPNLSIEPAANLGDSPHLALFRSACSAIERELGRAKDPLRLELAQAASTEDFVAKCRRSPWEAAALAGRTIWLQPDRVLSRFGDLTPIARHECVHAWLRANKIPPRSPLLEEAIALGAAGQTARLPPAKVLSPRELKVTEAMIQNPRSQRELEQALARAAATIWPNAKKLPKSKLLEALLARDWTTTPLGATLGPREP